MLTLITPKQFNDAIFSMKGISKQMVENHLKLYEGYVKSHNTIREQLNSLSEDDYEKAGATYSKIRELKVELSFALTSIVNHELYFNNLGGKGGEPNGKLRDQIDRDFGSFENFRQDFKATGMAARGWVWLGWNTRDKVLFNYLGDSHNTYLIWNVVPVMTLDVYEHAYYMDYGVRRADYIEAYFQNINWKSIQNNLL
jgi:Fe-Mn family superoxide dismutase